MKGLINIVGILFVFAIAEQPGFAQTAKPLPEQFQQLRRKLAFARDVQSITRDEHAAELLMTAETDLRRANRLMRERRVVMAHSHLSRAEIAINQALKILFRDVIQKRKEKLDQLIKEAEAIVPGSGIPEAQKTLEQGINNHQLAIQAFKDNQIEKSSQHYNRAIYLIEKAIDLVKNSDQSIEQQAADEAYRFDQYLSQNKAVIEASGNGTVKRNQQLALNLARKADIARKNGEYRLAIDYYHQATRLLLRALNMAQGKTEQSALRVYDEITLLDELIENVEQSFLSESADEKTELLLNRAKQLQQEAHQALDNQNYGIALRRSQLARDLIERMVKKTRRPPKDISEQIAAQLEALNYELEELEFFMSDSSDQEARKLLNYAALARDRAEQALKNKNYRVSIEVIKMAKQLASSADQLVNTGAEQQTNATLIHQKLQRLENGLLKTRAEAAPVMTPQINFRIEQTQKMVNLARENYEKGFLHVADSFIILGNGYLDQCRDLIK